jgi:hypothetical protein
MNELFADPFASHVCQAILQTLNGRPQVNIAKRDKKRKTRTEDTTTVQTPESFADLKSKYISIVQGWDQTHLQALVFDKYAVPLLQLIIESDIPKKSKKSKSGSCTLAEVILFGGSDASFDDEGFFKSGRFLTARTKRVHNTVIT